MLDSQRLGHDGIWRVLQVCVLLAFLIPILITGQSRSGSIEGRITRPDGQPAREVRVSAITAAAPGTPVSAGANLLAGITETDAGGRYRLTALPAGRYLVAAGFLDSPTYFPGARTVEAATMLTVTAGGTLRNISFQVAGISGVVVSGRVIVPEGVAPATMTVELSGLDEVAVSPDGAFRFKHVPPGNYALSLKIGDMMSNAQPAPLGITVADRDVTGLRFMVQPHIEVAGRIVVEGTEPRPRTTYLIFSPFRGGLFREDGFLKTDGEGFAAWLVEGEYRVSWGPIPPGYAVKSLTSGSTDLLTRPLKVVAGSPPEPIVLTLSLSATEVSSQPVAFVETEMVVFETALHPEITLRFATYQGGRRGGALWHNGSAGVRALPEGDYRISWDSLPPGYTLKSLTSGSTDLLAHPLRIIPGAEPEPVVITLARSQPWPRVSGRLTGAQNIPASDAITMTLQPMTSVLLGNPQTLVSPDGAFDFPEVPPGLYVIRTNPEWPVSPGTITIAPADRGLTKVDLAASPGREISGRVQLASPPAEELPLVFELSSGIRTISISTVMKLDGTFKTRFPEGNYNVSLSAPPGFRTRAITYGNANLISDRATIRRNDRAEELRIRLIGPAVRVIGETALISRCVQCPAPPFPSLASAARVTDTVKLSLVVSNGGTVTDASVISGHQMLRQAALQAVRRWRFQPEFNNSESSESSGLVSILFAFE